MAGSRLGSRLCIPDILWAECRKLGWGMLGFLTAIFWAHKITNYNGSFSPTHPNCWLGSQFQAPDTPYTNRQRSPAKKKKGKAGGEARGIGMGVKKNTQQTSSSCLIIPCSQAPQEALPRMCCLPVLPSLHHLCLAGLSHPPSVSCSSPEQLPAAAAATFTLL